MESPPGFEVPSSLAPQVELDRTGRLVPKLSAQERGPRAGLQL
jgi:hypothetical protein